MRLASHLQRTEAEARQTVSLDEFYRWMAFDELVGLGHRAENHQAAIIGTFICRAMSGGKVKPEDFLRDVPEWWHEGETLVDEFRKAFRR
jgi:hypothetical protein